MPENTLERGCKLLLSSQRATTPCLRTVLRAQVLYAKYLHSKYVSRWIGPGSHVAETSTMESSSHASPPKNPLNAGLAPRASLVCCSRDSLVGAASTRSELSGPQRRSPNHRMPSTTEVAARCGESISAHSSSERPRRRVSSPRPRGGVMVEVSSPIVMSVVLLRQRARVGAEQ